MESTVMGQFITRHRFRFFILVLGTLCLSSIFSNVITVNFTINCMDPSKSKHNETNINYSLHFYTSREKTSIQWAVSIASMIATFPFSYICTRFGARYIFFASGVVSSISTALIPLSADWGLIWFLVMRVLQGFAYAVDFAVVGIISTRWASMSDISIFLSMLTLFPAFSNIFTNSIAGFICDSEYGWPLVHYVHGIVCMFLFTLWFIFYTDRPENNRMVSKKELAKIHEGKSETHKNAVKKIPYLKICKNPVVWSVWLNASTDLLSSFFFIIYGPTYNTKVLKYGYTETGIAGAIDAFPIIPLKLAAGYASDAYNCVPERQKMWIYNSLCTLIPAAIFVIVSFLPTNIPSLSIILFGISIASIGFNGGGYYRCCCLVTREHAEFVLAFTQFIKSAVFFIAPLLVELFVHDEEDASQWHTIFYLMAGSLIISNAIFCYYATDKPASFTSIDENIETEEHEQSIPRKNSDKFAEISLNSGTFIEKM